ncbi:DUF58 domain-containing protein [soil metagenome]
MLGAGVPIGVVAYQLGAPLIALFYDVLVLLALALDARWAGDRSFFSSGRKHDPVLSVRTSNRVVYSLEHDAPRVLRMKVRDEAPMGFSPVGNEQRITLEPRGRFEMEYQVTPLERGTVRFRGSYLRVEGPFGLATRDLVLDDGSDARVYPNVLALREFDLLNQRGRLRQLGVRRASGRGAGTEFESLRMYQMGDDFRKIDHKASARRGELVVRQYEPEKSQAIILAVDCGRGMLAEVNGVRKLDLVLDAIIMLSHAASAASDQIGLLAFADRVQRFIAPRKGRGQLGAVLEACHDRIAEPVESDPVGAFGYLNGHWKRRAFLVVFSPAEDPDAARALATALSPTARRHLTLVVRVTDPRIKEMAEKPLMASGDLYERAAGTLLIEDRRAAGGILRAAGIRSLEAEPQDLASALVNYYLEVKERGLL